METRIQEVGLVFHFTIVPFLISSHAEKRHLDLQICIRFDINEADAIARIAIIFVAFLATSNVVSFQIFFAKSKLCRDDESTHFTESHGQQRFVNTTVEPFVRFDSIISNLHRHAFVDMSCVDEFGVRRNAEAAAAFLVGKNNISNQMNLTDVTNFGMAQLDI